MAISICSLAGGGTVLIPAGLWLTGPIELKSNVNLHAELGTLVIFSTDYTLYPIVMPEGRTKSLISGSNLQNVSITGEGIPAAGIILPGKSIKDYQAIKDFFRPNMVVFTNCKNITTGCCV